LVLKFDGTIVQLINKEAFDSGHARFFDLIPSDSGLKSEDFEEMEVLIQWFWLIAG